MTSSLITTSATVNVMKTFRLQKYIFKFDDYNKTQRVLCHAKSLYDRISKHVSRDKGLFCDIGFLSDLERVEYLTDLYDLSASIRINNVGLNNKGVFVIYDATSHVKANDYKLCRVYHYDPNNESGSSLLKLVFNDTDKEYDDVIIVKD